MMSHQITSHDVWEDFHRVRWDQLLPLVIGAVQELESEQDKSLSSVWSTIKSMGTRLVSVERDVEGLKGTVERLTGTYTIFIKLSLKL